MFVIKKVKDQVPWAYVIEDLNSDDTTEKLFKPKPQNTYHTIFRIDNFIKKNEDNCFDNLFKSLIDESDILYG